MQTKHFLGIHSAVLIALLVLAAGCGKSEPPAQVGTAPTKPDSTAPAENKPVAAVQAPAATSESAKPVSEAVSKPPPPPVTNVPAATVAAVPSTNKPGGLLEQAKTGLAALSQDEMSKGLIDALSKGLQQAIANLGHDGGFLTNLNVKIPMPEKLQKVESALRAMKQDKLADDFVATMNHAAEQAVPQAGAVFSDALKGMTIEDAKSILCGPNDAATQYFQKATQTNLYARFYPIVQKATQAVGVTAAYKKLMEKASVSQSLGSLGNMLGGSLLGQDSLDLDGYVTNKAMDGLFKMVATEEARIRQSPVARTTDLLQKVFGAVKQ